MPDDRTTVTELGTALGMLGCAGPAEALARRPPELAIEAADWERLTELHRSGSHRNEFAVAWANGRAFLEAPDALRRRPPMLIEWTGGRRPPGDEVAPVDLRVDHVYLVSCKYLSRLVANASPARLFDGLLATAGQWKTGDWYQEVAPQAYLRLYRECRAATGLSQLPGDPGALDSAQRQQLRRALGSARYPAGAAGAYRELCREVSARSAERWRSNVDSATLRQRLAWRLLRIGNAAYFVLGTDQRQPIRLRVASPWDWRQSYRLLNLDIEAADAGQPQVQWTITYRRRNNDAVGHVRGHVEVRWSHGRFAQPPEAKVYIDTSPQELPGYFPIEGAADQPSLWG